MYKVHNTHESLGIVRSQLSVDKRNNFKQKKKIDSQALLKVVIAAAPVRS